MTVRQWYHVSSLRHKPFVIYMSENCIKIYFAINIYYFILFIFKIWFNMFQSVKLTCAMTLPLLWVWPESSLQQDSNMGHQHERWMNKLTKLVSSVGRALASNLRSLVQIPAMYSGWPGHYNNVGCLARLDISLELNPVTEGK